MALLAGGGRARAGGAGRESDSSSAGGGDDGGAAAAAGAAGECVRVLAPTAFDEVRWELLPAQGSPRIPLPALRSSGKITVLVITKFLRMRLALDRATPLAVSCAGEELLGSMTLNLLVRKVWPESQGHLVLDYRVGPRGAPPSGAAGAAPGPKPDPR